MRTKVEKKKYKFHDYAHLWVKKHNIKGLVVVSNDTIETCEFFEKDTGDSVAYVSILEVYPHSVFDNNTVLVYRSPWLRTIKNMINDWARYYGYPRKIKILLNEYKEI
jgi:hypothetical protein